MTLKVAGNFPGNFLKKSRGDNRSTIDVMMEMRSRSVIAISPLFCLLTKIGFGF
jgi:hypothetical protein